MHDASDILARTSGLRSEAPGLIFAFAADASGRAERIAPEDIARARAERLWVWVHLDLVDQRLQGWVRAACGLPPGAAALFAGQETAQEAGQDAGAAPQPGEVFGYGADFLVDVERTTTSVGRYAFSVSERLLVTGLRRPMVGIGAARRALEAGARHATAYGVFAAMATAFTRAGMQRLDAAQQELDAVEDHLLAFGPSADSQAMKSVRRLAVSLHRPVAGMLELFREAGEAEEEDEPALPPAGQAALAGLEARLGALDQAVMQISDRARMLQDELMAEHANQTNRSLRALTVLSTLLLPGTLIAGIFGMNTDGLPFAHGRWGFLAAMAMLCGATFVFYRVLVRMGASTRDD